MPHITTYNPLPISFTHGKGIWLYDHAGHAYLDGLSGIAVCGLGYNHPDITATIQQQATKILHTSNAFVIPEQQTLAKKLNELTGTEQAFFSNSGAEANEAAIKLTRLFGHKKNIDNPTIIVMEKAFHGRTMATLTASAPKIQAGFEPLVPGFIRAPFNNIEALKHIAKQHKEVVAIMLEPIQGEGGIHCADRTYLQQVAELCKQQDWLLIIDEIQTGNGRTGEFYAYMHAKIQPDIITTAKGLGNGIPIGATLMGTRASDLFKPGNHGSTFGGNPLACATALKVIEIIERDQLCANAKKQGEWILAALQQQLKNIPCVKEIRGQGLMIGIELNKPASDARAIGLKYGLIFNITAETVIRLLPPLIINEEQASELVLRLHQVLKAYC